MAHRIGFDLSQFLSPLGNVGIGAQQLGVQNANAIARQWQDLGDEALRQKLLRDQMAEQSRQFDVTQAGLDARSQAAIEAAQRNLQMKLDSLAQRDLRKNRLSLLGDLTSAFAAGDENAMRGAQTRAGVVDPSMQVVLPGDELPQRQAAAPELLSEAGVFGDAPQLSKALSVSVSGKPVMNEDAAAARQREQDVVGSLLSPLSGSPYADAYAPAIEGGLSLAGRGVRGRDAAKIALDQANREADRLGRRDNALIAAGQRESSHDMQGIAMQRKLLFDLDANVSKVVADKSSQAKLGEAQSALGMLDRSAAMLDSGVPVGELTGVLNSMASVMKGALSDRDVAMYMGGAGEWSRLLSKMQNWVPGNDPKMDRAFIEQVKRAGKIASDAIRARIEEAGIASRDQVYASQLPYEQAFPGQDPYYTMAKYGLDAHQRLTGGAAPTEDDIAAEAARLRAVMPGRFAMPQVPLPLQGSSRRASSNVTVRGPVGSVRPGAPATPGELGPPVQAAPIPPQPTQADPFDQEIERALTE